MPSAMSRPSEPVDTVSISIDLLFLPSRMIEPLPKLGSIWESAASRAFDLSMEEPSVTKRTTGFDISQLLMTGIRKSDNASPSRGRSPVWMQCTRYVLCSQYVLIPNLPWFLSFDQFSGFDADAVPQNKTPHR